MNNTPYNRIYELYRFKTIKQNGYKAKLVGFTGEKFILATTEKVNSSFRKLDKDTFISKKYRNTADNPITYFYIYCDESCLIKQHPKLDQIKAR